MPIVTVIGVFVYLEFLTQIFNIVFHILLIQNFYRKILNRTL